MIKTILLLTSFFLLVSCETSQEIANTENSITSGKVLRMEDSMVFTRDERTEELKYLGNIEKVAIIEVKEGSADYKRFQEVDKETYKGFDKKEIEGDEFYDKNNNAKTYSGSQEEYFNSISSKDDYAIENKDRIVENKLIKPNQSIETTGTTSAPFEYITKDINDREMAEDTSNIPIGQAVAGYTINDTQVMTKINNVNISTVNEEKVQEQEQFKSVEKILEKTLRNKIDEINQEMKIESQQQEELVKQVKKIPSFEYKKEDLNDDNYIYPVKNKDKENIANDISSINSRKRVIVPDELNKQYEQENKVRRAQVINEEDYLRNQISKQLINEYIEEIENDFSRFDKLGNEYKIASTIEQISENITNQEQLENFNKKLTVATIKEIDEEDVIPKSFSLKATRDTAIKIRNNKEITQVDFTRLLIKLQKISNSKKKATLTLNSKKEFVVDKKGVEEIKKLTKQVQENSLRGRSFDEDEFKKQLDKLVKVKISNRNYIDEKTKQKNREDIKELIRKLKAINN